MGASMAITLEQGTAVAAIGVALLTYYRTRAAERRVRRAELVRNYTNDFYLNRDVTALFMDIDHERFVYDDGILGSDRELTLIHLLDYFNVLGHNWKRRIISLDDMLPTTLAYAALRAWENPGIRQYLVQIRIWDEERYLGASGSGFRYFEELAIEVALLCGRIEPSARISDLIISTRLRRSMPVFLFTRFPLVARAWRALLRLPRSLSTPRSESRESS
jgi:hypothetical protein